MADKIPHQLLGAFLMFLVFLPFVAESRPVKLELPQNQELDQRRSSGSLDDIGRPTFDSLFHLIFNHTLSMGVWPKSYFPLTYGFTSTSTMPSGLDSQAVVAAVDAAFREWQSAVPKFAFQKIYPGDNARIKISFTTLNPDNYGFGYYPPDGRLSPDGRLYLDVNHTSWSTKSYPAVNELDLMSGALHEIGHTLGLEHTDNRDAVMYPSIKSGTLKRKLSQEDISRIQSLYYYSQAQPHLELPKSI